MGDMGDDFKAWNEVRKAKKLNNMESSTEILDGRGIEFETKNGGTHLIVQHNGKVADFWPSTGKYNVRGSSKYKRGVYNLIGDLTNDT